MKMPGAKVVVFNAAAVLITTAAVVGLLRSFLAKPAAAPCSERYHHSTALMLERGGALLTAADLQSSLAGRDVGVIENVSVGRIPGAPASVALTVRLPRGSTSPDGSPRGGISFPWDPRSVQGKSAVCLSYSVLLPADFAFNRGGTLPGISGAEPGMVASDTFAARMAWREAGQGGVTLRVTSAGETRSSTAERETFAFPRGRWVRLEQEVVLNTPREADGVLRVWVDGTLAIDRGDLVYRMRPGVTVSGVAADVFYGTASGAGAAPADTKISLTPFDIRWQ
jgi:hypothetical protein